jgi:hypothetical protein
MAKKKGRTDAQTTRNMQSNLNRRMANALQQSAGASAGIREGMDYGRFPGSAGDRIQTEREDRAARRKEGGKMESKKMATRPTERPTRAPAASQKPTPRPSTAEERAAGARGNKQDPGPIAKDMKAGGMVKKMAMGGKCRGMGAATRGGNFSRG